MAPPFVFGTHLATASNASQICRADIFDIFSGFEGQVILDELSVSRPQRNGLKLKFIRYFEIQACGCSGEAQVSRDQFCGQHIHITTHGLTDIGSELVTLADVSSPSQIHPSASGNAVRPQRDPGQPTQVRDAGGSCKRSRTLPDLSSASKMLASRRSCTCQSLGRRSQQTLSRCHDLLL